MSGDQLTIEDLRAQLANCREILANAATEAARLAKDEMLVESNTLARVMRVINANTGIPAAEKQVLKRCIEQEFEIDIQYSPPSPLFPKR